MKYDLIEDQYKEKTFEAIYRIDTNIDEGDEGDEGDEEFIIVDLELVE